MNIAFVQPHVIKILCCGLLLNFLPVLAANQSGLSHLIIVKSSDNSYFDQSITVMTEQLDKHVHIKVLRASELGAETLRFADNRLFVTFGQAAMEAVHGLGTNYASINAYLTHEQYLQYRSYIQMAVVLDQPLSRYLAFCKLLLNVNNIGLITEELIQLSPQETRLLEDLKFNLNQFQLDSSKKLLPVLRNLIRQNDMLLMLPRQTIYNRDSLKGVLLTSYRNRKPTISYSPAHVKSGALASIYSSPVDIGRHLSTLVKQIQQDPAQQQAKIHFAQRYSIVTNPKVARVLGISLPNELELRAKLERLIR